MPLNTLTHLPKRHPALYILTLVIFPLIALAIYENTHATTVPFDQHPYNVSPRHFQNCETKWVGTEYHPLRVCENVWGQLTREAILQESDYFSNL